METATYADLRHTTASERREMTPKEAEYFCNLFFTEKDGLSAPEKDGAPTGYRIMLQRIGWSGRDLGPDGDITPSLLLFTTILSDRPGTAVLWAYTLVKMCEDYDQVNLDAFAEVFPWGVPTNEGYRRIWEEQKDAAAPNSNGLDRPEVWR